MYTSKASRRAPGVIGLIVVALIVLGMVLAARSFMHRTDCLNNVLSSPGQAPACATQQPSSN